jgi:hypothetical protein
MSKKHFIALANVIRQNNAALAHIKNAADAFTPVQIKLLAEFCKSTNPAFKSDRWFDYIDGKCGQNGGKIGK